MVCNLAMHTLLTNHVHTHSDTLTLSLSLFLSHTQRRITFAYPSVTYFDDNVALMDLSIRGDSVISYFLAHLLPQPICCFLHVARVPAHAIYSNNGAKRRIGYATAKLAAKRAHGNHVSSRRHAFIPPQPHEISQLGH